MTTGRPLAPANYQLYFDTTVGRLLVWTGSSWANVPTALTVEGGTTEPSGPSARQIWYNETTDTLQAYDGTWKPVVPAPPPPSPLSVVELFSGNVELSNTKWKDTGADLSDLADFSIIGGIMARSSTKRWGRLFLPIIKSQFSAMNNNTNNTFPGSESDRVTVYQHEVTLSFGKDSSGNILYACTSQNVDLRPMKIWTYR